MIYRLEETISSNTPQTAPEVFKLAVTKGVITNVWVFFPWGCANLVGVQIWYEGFQLWPISKGEWLRGNDILFHFEDPYKVETEPTFLRIKAYNEDDTYDHTPWVMLEVVKQEEIPAIERFLQTLKGLG